MFQRNGQMVHASCTIFLCVTDIDFWKEGKIISRNSKLHIPVQADTVNLNISNHKNGRKGQNIRHDTTGLKGAVEDLSRRVHHILSSSGSEYNLIYDVFDNKQWTYIQISYIVASVIVTEKYLNLCHT